jgi:hypothetical protein
VSETRDDDVLTMLELQLSAEIGLAAHTWGIPLTPAVRDGIAVRLVSLGWTQDPEFEAEEARSE